MIEQYYFLFGLALVWIAIATVQDIRKTEVANWLTFSLVGFALAYRAFYANWTGDWNFLYFGVLGFAIFFVMGNIFYYSKVFAGGDAKLLFGLGAVLPFSSYLGLVFESVGFLFVLFTVGWIYSITYSVFLVFPRFKSFKKEFGKKFRNSKMFLSAMVFIGLAFLVLLRDIFGVIIFVSVVLFFFLFIYTRTLEKCCMIRLVKPGDLQEGDWLERDVRIGRKIVKKSVHGLSLGEIKMFKKAKKSVSILRGVPFIPAFLISWIIMVFFYLVLGFSFLEFFSF